MLPPLMVFLAAVPGLTTHAERKDFKETGRFEEVQSFCQAFPKAFAGKVRCEAFGTTPLGRPMLVFVASADGTVTPQQAQAKNRPVLFLQGGIHAGEIDGKDAGLLVLRDLLEGTVLPGVLSKVTLVFVPVFNVDGHERFGVNQRPNQRGPKETGWRVTSQNLNLNRDYLKAEAPEMRAMLRLLNTWDPILLADLHVTDGAKFQHDVSITSEPNLFGPDGLRSLGKSLKVALFAELEAKGHLPVNFYPSFVKEDDPASGFVYGWPPPRFSHSYWAARNRYGLLVETHSWKAYKQRVATTVDVIVGLLRLTAEDGARWLKAAREADAADSKRAGKEVVLMWDARTNVARTIEFQGYAYTREPSDVSGQMWVRYDESKPQAWNVPFSDELEPALTLRVPEAGWVVPPPNAEWVAEKLRLHGIEFIELKETTLAVEQFRLAEPKFRPSPYEGRQVLASREGVWNQTSRTFPKSTLFIPSAQRRVRLALHLLEPQAPDSLAAWGFFNAHLEQKEYLEDYLTEEFAREQLKDPAVRAAFEAKLKDETFAKDPQRRLSFFAQLHPSADPTLWVIPAFRVAKLP